jgi:phospholipid/cholesterol/gamma-HCH transport system substrate-binding protein
MAVRLRRRLLGLVFVGLLVLASWASYADYRHAFSDDLPVTARLGHASGLLLEPEADVKVHGLVVGRVASVSTDGAGVTARLALRPEYAADVPAAARARLMPSTLFGHPYVELVPSGAGDAEPVGAGDVLAADRSARTLALQRVLSDVYPLLRAVRPADLARTLYAVSHALEGRGEAVGANLERLDRYLRGLNPHLDTLGADAAALGEVSDTYADAAPDLRRVVDALASTSRTLSSQRAALDAFFAGVTGAAGTGRTVLAENEANLVRLADTSRPVLALLARYAPEYPCLLRGLARYHPRLAEAFSPNALHITLETVRWRKPYDRDEAPANADTRGPRCYELPDPPVPAPRIPGGPVRDGSDGPYDYAAPSGSGAGDVGRLLGRPLRGSGAPTPSGR